MNKIDVLSRINPQMKAVLAKEDELAGDANDTSVGFEQMRLNYIEGRRYWTQDAPEMNEVREAALPTPHGSVTVRFYFPDDRRGLPPIIYAHGGGFVLGNLDTHDRITRVLARDSACPVVAIDYSLSPEAKFPVAVEQVAAVATYLHEHGAEEGVDPDALSFAGDSGGAHLSLGATFYLREEMGDSSFVKTLLLFYGWFGLSDSMSMRLLGGPWDGLTKEDWDFYMGLYANDAKDLEKSPYSNCFLNDMGHDMPACYIAAAEFDPLRNDSELLATILENAKVPHRFELFEGVIHAFLHYTLMLDAANDALSHAAAFHNEQLGIARS